MCLTLGSKPVITTTFKPAGTNANFINIHSQEMLEIRTYERGVENETLACGTRVQLHQPIVSAKLGKVQSPVSVKTASGVILRIHFELEDDTAKNVYLEGDARVIFVGELTPEAWKY